MSKNNNGFNPAEDSEDFIDIKNILFLCLSKWKWFVLSLLITLGIATVYCLCTPPVYTRTALVLIKDDSKGKSVSSEFESFYDMGLFQSNTNVHNELIVFSSPALLTEVANKMNLQTKYSVPGRFHKDVAYGANLPAVVSMPDLKDNESGSFTMNIRPDGTVVFSDFILNGEKTDTKETKGRLSETVSTPLGAMTVTPAQGYQAGEAYTVYVVRSGIYSTVNALSTALSVSLNNDKSSVINLSYQDNSARRAEDVLDMLITTYNENWVKDKNQIAVATSYFINERLSIIEHELGSVDSDISSFKSEHKLTDIQAESRLYLSQTNEMSNKLLSINNQLYMTEYVRDYLSNEHNSHQLLPANSGIENSIESLISEYNKMLLQRNSLAANSSPSNPIVVDMDNTLNDMREAIIKSVDNQIITLKTQIQSLQTTEKETSAKITSTPEQARYLISVERQQKVKESLYLFLLQKLEENELSQAFTAYSTRIISPPVGSPKPTAPVKRNIMLIAFILGLIIPAGLIFLIEKMNTKLRGKKDLENISIPLIGEIPLTSARKGRLKKIVRVADKKKQDEEMQVVVKAGNRNVVNEAFRVLRTNLEFMTDKEGKSNVIAVTSFNPGSGKSFLTINIAVSLTLKDKKVLVIDGDLRHGSSSMYVGSPKTGLSEYLAGRIDNCEQITVHDTKFPGLSIIPIGSIPPNPSELLFNGRLETLLASVRGSYDYVFVDCPPINMVADTQIICQYIDRTIFVVRAGLLERSMLDELESLYENKKYPNIVLILNGTDIGSHSGYKYGYKYGYGYGYGSKSYYGSDRH